MFVFVKIRRVAFKIHEIFRIVGQKIYFYNALEKHAIEILLDFKMLSEILLPKKTYFFLKIFLHFQRIQFDF